MFNVKLESFDAGATPKVIREVKALVPNLTLMDVSLLRSLPNRILDAKFHSHFPTSTGQEVRRVITKSPEGEPVKGGC